VRAVAEELGAPHFAVECDVASPESVRAAFASIAARHAKIDVLINNAATYEPFTVTEATDEQILTPILTNFAGPIFCSRAAIPMMEKGGYIINVSSGSVALDYPMLSLYQSTKAGLERFTQSLSREVEPLGICVATVRAGPMMEEGKAVNWNPQIAMRFHQACIAAGINTGAGPISQFNSVTDVFSALLDLPADVRIPHTSIEARQP
jgi:meso-butanediol dehydrogenase / (S,S)-butanediol dehydrogenase / diacetyl reductase